MRLTIPLNKPQKNNGAGELEQCEIDAELPLETHTGLQSGANNLSYVRSPTASIDPLCLQGICPITPISVMESAFNKSIDFFKTATQPITNYGKAVLGKAIEGAQGGLQTGGFAAIGIGGSASTGLALDTSGQLCQVTTVCGILVPIIGGETNAQYSLSTGRVTPGDTAWQILGVAGAAIGIGIGGKAEISAASDGGIGVQGGGAMGLFLGGGIQVCKQYISNKCKNL